MAVPIPNSYWVRPGQLLAGEYPSDRHSDLAERRIRALLDAGVSYFIDLTRKQDTLDPYELRLRAAATERGAEVTYVRRAIRDLGLPSAAQMRAILDEIDAAIAAGRIVYVHCWGGVGRTGTVVGCHLVRNGMSGDAALEELARMFATMAEKSALHARSPETDAQCDFVRGWREPPV